jgi:outer membrane protein assembly factor BamA
VGHYLGGDFNFMKGEFSWSRYKILFGENILASRFKIGVLEELGDNGNSAIDDRFKLGGAKTVRGYAENDLGPKWTTEEAPTLAGLPKGGKLLLLTNIELRRSLFWRLGGTVFMDAGNVFYDIKNFKFNNLQATSGLGLQFFTPIGPIRFDYAFKLKEKLDLGDYAYHLTLLYAF